MARYVIEPTITPGEWMVTVEAKPPAPINIVFDGRAQDCIDWLERKGAERLGPRLFELAE